MRQAGVRPTAPRASGPSPGDLEAAVESHCEAPHVASWKTSQARPRAWAASQCTQREWGDAQKSCCPAQCDTTHTERPQCVGSDVGRAALDNGGTASSQIPCASAHWEKCQRCMGRTRGRPGALPRNLARDAEPWERAQGAACGDSLSPVPLSARARGPRGPAAAPRAIRDVDVVRGVDVARDVRDAGPRRQAPSSSASRGPFAGPCENACGPPP